MKIPFHRPNIPSDFNKIKNNSIRDGWLTTGPLVENFENKLSKYLEAKHVIGLNSCTAALHLALAAKNFGKGDKFILPTMTFAATIECGEYIGMEPMLVDCNQEGFLLDYNVLEDIIKNDKAIKAIIPVHYAGEGVDLKYLWELAERYDLFVLEDAAHGLETYYEDIKIGNTNYAAAFSFYANKNLTTGGEGGAISTNNTSLAKKIKKLSLHGMTGDGWNRFKKSGKWEYDIVELGYKYNLTDYSASYGIWQFQFLKEWQVKRNRITKMYISSLKNTDGIILPKLTQGHSMHLFVIKLDTGKWSISRNQFIEKMNERGIGLAVHYKPIHKLFYYYNKYGFRDSDYPNANSLYESMVSLPIYPDLTDDNISYISNNIKDLYNIYCK